MSNLHGEFLSIHKISQAYPGVPKTQGPQRSHISSDLLLSDLSALARNVFLKAAKRERISQAAWRITLGR